MPEEEKSVRRKAGAKVAGGIAMMVFAPITSIVGFGTTILGAATGIIGGGGAKLISMGYSDPDKKALWQERSQRARSFGTKAFLGGLILSFPYAAGSIAILEGGVQALADDDSYGMWPALKSVARLTSGGLPQPGDPVNDLTPVVSPPQHHDAQPHRAQNIDNQQQIQPAVSISTDYIARAANFEEATKRYQEEIRKKPEAQKYKMVGDLVHLPNGSYEATYIHPSYTGAPEKCPEEFKVKQQFNDKMELIAAKIGPKAECIVPPIKEGTEFKLLKLENGKVTDCKAAAQDAQAMREAGFGSQSYAGPAPNKGPQTHSSRTA